MKRRKKRSRRKGTKRSMKWREYIGGGGEGGGEEGGRVGGRGGGK